MKKGFLLLLFASVAQAGNPLWTFTPLTATRISVPANGSAVVQYTVTNQSRKAYTLAMNAIQGISQDTSGNYCKNPFTLGYQQSCTLKLNVTGSQLSGDINRGPVVCDQGSQGLQCYQPSLSQQLNIAIGESEYSVGGSISGLTGTVYLENNNANQQAFNSNGSFALTNQLTSGQTYSVTVAAQPNNQTCSVANASGVIASSNITNVAVTCSTNAYTVGGTVSGLSGTVVLQDNGGDNLTINSNGSFTFSNPVATGSSYSVTVLTQPSGQTCTVSNGSGTMGGSNVTNVGVSCSTNTTLSTSVSQLALSVTGLTEYGLSPTTSGVARKITITNTGSLTATGFNITYPTFPSGTTTASTCGSSLAAGSTCIITIAPGANATSSCNTNHTAPTPGVITVSATNVATPVTTNVVVLGYSCQYQGGYVYAFDDTTSNTGSVGGKVATTSDQAAADPNGIIWSSNGTSGAVAYDTIYGISETSTTLSANPSSGQVTGQTACKGANDGACNTKNIYVYYQNNATNHPINLTYYAAGLCKQTISGYADWYLPAICEMGYGLTACGTSSAPTLQNMQKSLIDIGGLSTPAGFYWSSTENAGGPQDNAWFEYFASGGGSGQFNSNKSSQLGVRCSRALTL